MMCIITIPLPPRTKKNHSRIITLKDGRKVLVPSKAYTKYEHDAGWFLKPLMIDYPVNVNATYYMDNNRKVDLINLHAALHDILVKHEVIADDNSKIIVSTDGSRVEYDKENPRTEIVITPSGDWAKKAER